jgi:hypothetical protein
MLVGIQGIQLLFVKQWENDLEGFPERICTGPSTTGPERQGPTDRIVLGDGLGVPWTLGLIAQALFQSLPLPQCSLALQVVARESQVQLMPPPNPAPGETHTISLM